MGENMKKALVVIGLMIVGVVLWDRLGPTVTASIGDGLRGVADTVDQRNPVERMVGR
jgi:hypothetical protein